MRLPGISGNVFSLEVDNAEAWKRLAVANLNFEDVEIIEVASAQHIVNGRPCKWVVTNIHGDPALVEQVEEWVKTGTLSLGG